MRIARADDRAALARLAALDSATPPRGRVLVAEVGGEVVAALSLDHHGPPVADPFRRTAAATALLELRARQLRERPAAPATRSIRRRLRALVRARGAALLR